MRFVVPAPLLDQNPGFRPGVEHLRIQQFVAQLAVEAFHIAILPRAAGLDECRLGAHTVDPGTPSVRTASVAVLPCGSSTSIWRSLATISSGL